MKLTAEQYRALRMLADAAPRGCTEPALIAQGVTVATLIDLVRTGYAWGTKETARAAGRKIEVVRVKITDAGQRALAH